ncbi:MAG TPA: ROK family protein [Flexivirga sp.]|uniref:ROK family protein n=1 Tax=Flexivirga sp. TaxID=1962927 RepID=UPI002B6217E5|nr:ROK family protein [Flexivirga sp.]HWC23035.1 ROK family protein [Flexivirga sp.]
MSDVVGCAVGVDIGGTKTVAALVDAGGGIIGRAVEATPGSDGPDAILATVLRLVRAVADGTRPRGVGVGSAGVIDHRSGVVLSATSVLRDWAGTPVRERLSDMTGLPVRVVNDVHAHALGEAWAGAAAGAESVLMIAVGTGVGASFVRSGEVWFGAHDVAGHLGHIPAAAAEGRPCVCGRTGHLEAVAAGPAICALYAERTGRTVTDVQEIVRCAAAGSAEAAGVLAEGGRALGAAVGGAINLLDPEVVVVGGGVVGAGELWWAPMESALRDQLLPTTAGIRVVRSKLGSDAALAGAARLVLDADRKMKERH